MRRHSQWRILSVPIHSYLFVFPKTYIWGSCPARVSMAHGCSAAKGVPDPISSPSHLQWQEVGVDVKGGGVSTLCPGLLSVPGTLSPACSTAGPCETRDACPVS